MGTDATPKREDRRPGDSGWARAAALALLLPACGGPRPDAADRAADSTYAAVMARLLVIHARPPRGTTREEREASADSARHEALRSFNLTPDSLLRLAGRIGSDPARSRRVWEAIAAASDSLLRATAPGDQEAGGFVGAGRLAVDSAASEPPVRPGPGSRLRTRPTNPDSVREFILRGKKPPPARGPPSP
ncbi:MAG: hypothetical protein ACE5HF_04240 [Gemmatimonadota bacterium]